MWLPYEYKYIYNTTEQKKKTIQGYFIIPQKNLHMGSIHKDGYQYTNLPQKQVILNYLRDLNKFYKSDWTTHLGRGRWGDNWPNLGVNTLCKIFEQY